jgi:hypothetical protein
MTLLYVSGPVVAAGAANAWQGALSALARVGDLPASIIYGWITSECNERNIEVRLPVREPALDALEPRDFVKDITERIRFADLVLRIFVAEDKSGPVESAIASLLKKKQLIVGANGAKVPRLERGLEGVVGVVPFDDEGMLRFSLGRFLNQFAPAARMAMAGGVY